MRTTPPFQSEDGVSRHDGCAPTLRFCDDGHRRSALSPHQRGLCAVDGAAVSAAAGGTARAGAARDRVEPGVGGDLWRAGGSCRVGLAAARVDADLYWSARFSAVVVAAQHPRIPARARHLVLLDPSLDAPAKALSHRPCGPPCEQAADRVGGDELSSVGSADRGSGHPAAGARDPDPFRGAWCGARGDDGDGGHQSHGLGDVPARTRSWRNRTMADNGEPS